MRMRRNAAAAMIVMAHSPADSNRISRLAVVFALDYLKAEATIKVSERCRRRTTPQRDAAPRRCRPSLRQQTHGFHRLRHARPVCRFCANMCQKSESHLWLLGPSSVAAAGTKALFVPIAKVFKGGKILHAQSYPTKSDALVGPGSIRELSEMEDIRFFAELSFFS